MPDRQVPRQPQVAPLGTVAATDGSPAVEPAQAWWGIFERSCWGFAIGAPDGTFVAMNTAFAEMHGYSVEELVGKPITTVLTPEWQGKLPELMRAAHESAHLSLETVHARLDGTTFPVQTDVVVARDENGRVLYCAVWVQDISERKRAEEAVRLIAEGTSSAISDEFFRALVKCLAHALRLRFAFVSEVVDPDGGSLRLVSFWTGADYGETFEYTTKGTPCELVVGKKLAYFSAGVQELFPGDRWLQEMGIESYLAIPLFDSSGNPLGHLGVMHDERMHEDPAAEPILRIFAARAGAELERKRAEDALQRAREELEGKIERQMLRRNPYRLTFREFTVLHLVAAGRADKEIARELVISPLTVHKHVANILGKMNAASRTEAGVRALREGLLD